MTTKPKEYPEPSSYELFPEAVLALLLPILPKVESWTIGELYYAPFVEKAVEKAKKGVFGTVSITHVELLPDNRFSYPGSWAGCSFRAFDILKILPNLKNISAKGIGGDTIGDGGEYLDIPSKASAVEAIHLEDCCLDADCLANIIGFSTGLKSFRYRFGGCASTGGGLSFVCSPELARALTPHNSTMRVLEIDNDRLLGFTSLGQELVDWRRELKKEADKVSEDLDEATTCNPHFPNLTHLGIGIQLASRFAILSGKKSLAEWLPSSLVELEIVGYGVHTLPDLKEEVVEVVRRRETLLPRLRVLRGVEECVENGKELRKEDEYVVEDRETETEEEEEGQESLYYSKIGDDCLGMVPWYAR